MSSIGKDILDTIIGEALVSAHCERVLVWEDDAEKILSDKFEYLLDENIELHKHMDRLQKEKIAKIESAWQDAELRADKNLNRVEELEATLKTLAAQAMYAAGYTKKGDWKNES